MRYSFERFLFVVIVSIAFEFASGLMPGSSLFALQNPSGIKSPADGGKLEDILAEMDRSAEEFTSMEAQLEYTKVTVIVNDRSTEKGSIYFEKSGGRTRVLIAFSEPSEKYVLFANGKVALYQPKIAEVDEYILSQKQDLVEQYLLLGFGTAGTELQKSYQIALRGETRADGQQAYVLELIPKSAKVRAQFQRIELWISPQSWQPVEQKFFEPGGDYVTTHYSGLKWNEKIPEKHFRLPLRGKVRTVRPQAQ